MFYEDAMCYRTVVFNGILGHSYAPSRALCDTDVAARTALNCVQTENRWR